jgi:hypothetical protein
VVLARSRLSQGKSYHLCAVRVSGEIVVSVVGPQTAGVRCPSTVEITAKQIRSRRSPTTTCQS